MPLLDLIKASRTSVQGNKEKRWQKEKELVVGSSGQPMPQPLQADGTEHGPVTQGPHHMVLT